MSPVTDVRDDEPERLATDPVGDDVAARPRRDGAVPVLVGVNVICTLAGLVQSVIVARAVGPAGLGAIGVLVALNSGVANLVDVRLFDVAAAVFFEQGDDAQRDRHRRSVVQLCVLANGALALLMILIGVGVGALLGRLFLDQAVRAVWVAGAALTVGLNYASGTLFGIQRLTGDFRRVGVWRLATQLGSVAVSLPIIIIWNNVSAYFVAMSVVALVSLLLNAYALASIWRHATGSSLVDRVDIRFAAPAFRRRVRAVIGANVYAYSKLVHRSGDVLLVAALGSDATAGVYRLARSLTDYTYVLYDGINQVYFPRFLAQLYDRKVDEFRRTAGLSAVFAALVTFAGVCGGALLLPVVVRTLVSGTFADAVPVTLVLLIPFFFVLGVHLWLWPLLLYRDEIGRLAWSSVAGAAAQVGVTVLLAKAGSFSPVDGAVGYVCFYLVGYVPLLLVLWRSIGRPVPTRS